MFAIDASRRRELLWAFAPLFIWIGVIFFLSSGSGSSAETSRIIRPLLEWLFPSAEPAAIDTYHAYIRKAAHFTEYFILACLAWRAFTTRAGTLTTALMSLGVVATVAAADEFNQSFNPMRTSSAWDVGLDVLGGAAAVALLLSARRVIPSRFGSARE